MKHQLVMAAPELVFSQGMFIADSDYKAYSPVAILRYDKDFLRTSSGMLDRRRISATVAKK